MPSPLMSTTSLSTKRHIRTRERNALILRLWPFAADVAKWLLPLQQSAQPFDGLHDQGPRRLPVYGKVREPREGP